MTLGDMKMKKRKVWKTYTLTKHIIYCVFYIQYVEYLPQKWICSGYLNVFFMNEICLFSSVCLPCSWL